MAKDPGQERSIHELRQEIAHSRDRLAKDLSGLKYELDFPLKFRKSFQRNTAIWVSAIVLTGVVMTARATTKKEKVVLDWRGKPAEQKKGEEQKKGMLAAGLAIGALKLVGTMVRPIIIGIVTKKLRGYGGGGGMPPPNRW
ncbi:hypothetical protein BH20VER2_BH20VER2_14720 [soil metagenome]